MSNRRVEFSMIRGSSLRRFLKLHFIMAFLLDFLPIVAFVAAYKFAGIFIATGVLMIGISLQAALQWFREGKVNPMLQTSLVVVLIFGSITLIFRNETFIQWKPTVASWLIAAGFLGMQLFTKKTAVEHLLAPALGENIVEPAAWRKLNLYWVVLFVVQGFVNLWLLYSFDLATWVTWHLIVLMGLTAISMVAQTIWLVKKLPPDSPTDDQPKL